MEKIQQKLKKMVSACISICFSAAVIKIMLSRNLEKKGLIWLAGYSSSSSETKKQLMPGTWRQEL